MTPLEAAQRLVSNGQPPSYNRLTDGIRACRNCNQPVTQHVSGCPWLSMPRIVAVLEAAERVVAAPMVEIEERVFDLKRALKGDQPA